MTTPPNKAMSVAETIKQKCRYSKPTWTTLYPAVRPTQAQKVFAYDRFVKNSIFMKFEQVSNLHPANLDNPILPVFRKANFSGVDYGMLQTALRLPSLQVGFTLQ